MHWHPKATTFDGMAADGFHPSAHGYARWADELSQRILAPEAFDSSCNVGQPV
jgi:lysophospholipase L1-like esterase